MLFAFVIILTALCSVPAVSFAGTTFGGELYSESTYVPEFGVLNEFQLRLASKASESFIPYVGYAGQWQNKTSESQEKLYDKSYHMLTVGVRAPLASFLGFLAEYRTEDRSRLGFYAGNIWEYEFSAAPLFTEFYGESMIIPSFHNDPISTLWIKQGLRYRFGGHWILDPFAEGYVRYSPTANLGRDTEQLRLGARAIYIFNAWSASFLVYQSFPKNQKSHEEALLVFGGAF